MEAAEDVDTPDVEADTDAAEYTTTMAPTAHARKFFVKT